MGQKLTATSFRGEIPSRGRFGLPSGQSSYASNCLLGSGEIRPLHEPLLEHTFTANPLVNLIKYAYRLPASRDGLYPEIWLPFAEEKVSFVKGPLVKDVYERYYWTTDNGATDDDLKSPMYMDTRANLADTLISDTDTTGFRLGVPRPQKEPCVTTTHLIHPTYKPWWEDGAAAPTDLDKALPGDLWYNGVTAPAEWFVKADTATAEWLDIGAELHGTVEKASDLAALTSFVKNAYVLVTDDPNPEKNGFYVAGIDAPCPASKWSHTDGKRQSDRQYSDSQLVPNDQDGSWLEVQRKFQIWDGIDIGDFTRFMVETPIPQADVDSIENAPPVHGVGDRYIIGLAPTGAWVGYETNIATSDGSAWTYEVPQTNWRALNLDDSLDYTFTGDDWWSTLPQDPVLDILNTPPAHVVTERYIVDDTPTGAWVGHEQEIATSTGAAWTYETAVLNWRVLVEDEVLHYKFDGTVWIIAGTKAVPSFGDYVYASTPSEFADVEDVWGWWYIKADPRTVTSTNDEQYINVVSPEAHTELVTRAYVYTYVNAIGEEGPPSNPRTYTALDGESWSVYNFDLDTPANDTAYPTVTGPDNRVPITSIRIYRTITGTSGSADYFYVGELPIAANLPTDATVTVPADFTYPKRYDVTNFSTAYTLTDVRHNDWLLVQVDEDRTDGGNFYYSKHWHRAVVKDSDGIIVTDHLASQEYTVDMTAGQYGYEWSDVPGAFGGAPKFNDDLLTSDVGLQDPLLTYSWFEPPKGLLGLTQHPNGFLVAFRGRDVFFSVPYRPHAWPEEFVLSVEHPVVNIGVFNNSIVIMTEGHPYIATGIVPEAISLSKYQTPIPCLGFEGVVTMPGAVLFPSRDGLYVASNNGFDNLTKSLMSEAEWEFHNPQWLRAARDGGAFVGFYDTDPDLEDIDTGFTINPSDPGAAFSHLKTGVMAEVDNIQTDYFSGKAYILSDNVVSWYDPVHNAPMDWEWWSKAASLANPTNIGALEVGWREEAHTIHDAPLYTGDELTIQVVADVLKADESPATERSITIDLGALKAEQSPLVAPARKINLPAGFKSDVWWFILKGNSVVEYVKLGETGADLKDV